MLSDAAWVVGLLILGVLVIGAVLAFVRAQSGRAEPGLEVPSPAVRERDDVGAPEADPSNGS